MKYLLQEFPLRDSPVLCVIVTTVLKDGSIQGLIHVADLCMGGADVEISLPF